MFRKKKTYKEVREHGLNPEQEEIQKQHWEKWEDHANKNP